MTVSRAYVRTLAHIQISGAIGCQMPPRSYVLQGQLRSPGKAETADMSVAQNLQPPTHTNVPPRSDREGAWHLKLSTSRSAATQTSTSRCSGTLRPDQTDPELARDCPSGR